MMTITLDRTAERDATRARFVRLAELTEPGSERDRLRHELVQQHLPLVRYFARRYADRGEPMDDLLQAGAMGLIKAVDRFDPGRGLEFSTYAAPTILGEIRRHFRDRTWAVHVNRGLQELSIEVTRTAGELTQELNRAPSVAELAVRTGRTEEEVLEALASAHAYTADSLEAPTGEDRTLGDSIGGEDQALVNVELHESLGPALATLPERERRILQLRFYGNQTQSQIAAQLGISQMHVSRLLSRTLAQLRQQLT
ncbi:MAG TPA: SigB/SigF/SigG family RNA polymerase sigma factor [Mycobacteriales bacterium]|jgi:RNA polymerase sigma-B factor|nr:SigB/SigF/SigG family RNA polymerase sigma factor [Mycobacteriales bacterium]